MALCDAAGVQPNVHNHTWEVENGQHELRGMLERIPDLKLGPDLNWLVRGGVDPVAFIAEHGPRIVYLHVRDQHADGRWSEAVGEGSMDYGAIGAALRRAGFSGYAAIELAFEGGFTPHAPDPREPAREPRVRAPDARLLTPRRPAACRRVPARRPSHPADHSARSARTGSVAAARRAGR
jgi:sugar phosphate isomerase/epimerase